MKLDSYLSDLEKKKTQNISDPLTDTSSCVSSSFYFLLSFTHTAPGGVHLDILPPAEFGEEAGLVEETMEEEAGLLDATLAVVGLLTGVEAAVRQIHSFNDDKIKL